MKVKIDDAWKEYEVEFGEENGYGGTSIVRYPVQMLIDFTKEVGYHIAAAYGAYIPESSIQCVIAVSDEDWMDTRYGENEFALEAQYTTEELIHI